MNNATKPMNLVTTPKDKETLPQQESVGYKEQKQGRIEILIYDKQVPKVTFSGNISGSMLDLGWRAMMKQYRVWKANLSRG